MNTEHLRTREQEISIWRKALALWKRFAYRLGVINTFVLITLFYWIPIGLTAIVLQLLRKDYLQKRPSRAVSYWQSKSGQENTTLEELQRQF